MCLIVCMEICGLGIPRWQNIPVILSEGVSIMLYSGNIVFVILCQDYIGLIVHMRYILL